MKRLRRRIVTLERLAYFDPLTDILNRRGFLMHMEKVFFRARHAQSKSGTDIPYQKFAVLFLDIDHFKAINDTYGHDAGDAVLRFAPQILQERLRGYDFVGHWGGEEFIILLADIPCTAAGTVAEDIRKAFAYTSFMYKRKKIGVTVSIGVSCFKKQKSAEAMIHEADRAMYFVKTHGRNGISVAE